MPDPNDIFDRIALGNQFAFAYVCRVCGALVDGNDYQPAPPRFLHVEFHRMLDIRTAWPPVTIVREQGENADD